MATVACIVNARISLIRCGEPPLKLDLDRDVYGPIAFAPDGNTVYFASPNDRGMVELWSADLTTRRRAPIVELQPRRVRAFRVGGRHRCLQDADAIARILPMSRSTGGATRQLTTFQSETPSYHPTRPLIAFTYGTWRRVVDDAKYPDIAQEIGVVDVSQSLPATKPSEVLEDSDSEDQAMTWSPNGKWIAFHTHKEMSDDVWLRPADGNAA